VGVRARATVNPKYSDFLWTALSSIWGALTRGQYATALKLLGMLISWLPPSLKEDFIPRTNLIMSSLDRIGSGDLEVMNEITDPNILRLYKIDLMDTYSSMAIPDLVSDLGDALQEGGYMEFQRISPVATSVPPGD